MKKIFVMLLVTAACCCLCACEKDIGAEAEEIVLHTQPQQVALPDLPTRETQDGTGAAEESTEATDSTGETYPWETEFNEDDYNRYEANFDGDGKSIFWTECGMFDQCRRDILYFSNGDIEDSYFYPSGNCSHDFFYGADGSYREAHYLDNGHIGIAEDGSVTTYMGTTIYEKNIAPDGSYSEYEYDHDGNPIYNIRQDTNGFYSECWYYENGNCGKSICNDPAAGTYQEAEYYENGNQKYSIYEDSQAGTYYEYECFENGNVKYSKQQSPDYTQEQRCDETGFFTYFYYKDSDHEIELITDEDGKLVKAVENGTVIEDAATLAQYAQGYNFRQ